MSRLGRGRSCAAGSPERCWLACWALTVGLYGVITGDAAYGLALGPGFGLALGLVSGLRQERAAPNEGIRRRICRRGGLRAGLRPNRGPAVWWSGGHAALRHAGVPGAGESGPLEIRRIPGGDGATALLRRSGNAYLFVHRLLRDYLAEPDPDRVQAAA